MTRTAVIFTAVLRPSLTCHDVQHHAVCVVVHRVKWSSPVDSYLQEMEDSFAGPPVAQAMWPTHEMQ